MPETIFVDLTIDTAFKKIFGSTLNKDVLIAFLNEVFRGRKHIIDLVYNKNEHHGDIATEGSVSFDLLCTGSNGDQFIIEVQRECHRNFRERALFYTSRLISEQAPKGKRKQWAYDITEVYLVAILEKGNSGQHFGDKYLYDICLCDRDNGEVFYDKFGHIYLDLSNFVKKENELVNDLDKWLYIFKHISTFERIPDFLRKPIFEKLFHIAEYSSLTKEEKMYYDADLKRKWDNYSALTTAIQTGEEKGRVAGIAEGRVAGIVEGRVAGRNEGEVLGVLKTAKAMKNMNLPLDTIIKATGLSLQEIEKL